MSATVTYNPIGTYSIQAAADLTAYRFVGLDSDVCGAGAKALGVAEMDAPSGTWVTVSLLGVLRVEAGGTVTAGAEVMSDASGKALDLAGEGVVGNGYALTAGSSGQFVLVLRGI